MTGLINVASTNWHPADSYGRKARELCRWLTGQGYRVNRFGPGAPRQVIQPALGGILPGYPTLYEQFGEMLNRGPRVAVTAWESTQIPTGWADVLNTMDAVSVGSQFTADVLRDNGVGAPVEVHPLGVSSAFFDVKQRSRTEDEPLTFMCFADRNYRKGWRTAFRAFKQAFGNDDRYRLLIKSRGRSLSLSDETNVDILMADYSDAQMVELYHRCHVLLFPTHGEGFGLPPREFAATGGPVLATNWSGTADNIQHWGIPLPYRPGESWINDLKRAGLGQWAHVDDDVLADLMQHVAAHYGVYANFGIRAAGYVRTHYRWSSFAESIERMWIEAGGIPCQQQTQNEADSGAKQVTMIHRSPTRRLTHSSTKPKQNTASTTG